jgi:ribonuclease PH
MSDLCVCIIIVTFDLHESSILTLQKRSVVLKTGLVTQASGSAYIEVGNTKVTCAV